MSNAREAGNNKIIDVMGAINQTTSEDPDKYTDTKPSVIKKELAEGQLYQVRGKHETATF